VSTWESQGPILIRIEDGVQPRWVNPALIEQVFEFAEHQDARVTKVVFTSGGTALFEMPMTAFFDRLAEAVASKYGL